MGPDAKLDAPAGGAPLAKGGDGRLAVRLETVLVPNAPGSWVADAPWDEYLLTVNADVPATITDVAIFCALGQRLPTRADRTGLAETTRETSRRYERSKQVARDDAGYWILTGGTVAFASGTVIAMGAAVGSMMSIGTVAAGIPAAAGLLMGGGIVLALAGVQQSVHNSQVQSVLSSRQTALPAEAAPSARLNLFFPVTPLARAIEVRYTADGRRYRLVMDLQEPLALAHRR